MINISIPSGHTAVSVCSSGGDMDLDTPQDSDTGSQLQTVRIEIHPDGILLYDAQATYEPGTSPLSTWVPIRAYSEESWKEDKVQGMKSRGDGPLDKFERCSNLILLFCCNE